MVIAGFILMVLGLFFTLTNVYLSFLRFPVHLAFGGSRKTYRCISVFPLIGSLLLWISLPLLPSSELRWFASILSIFDTGGIHWCLAAMWWTGQLSDVFRNRTNGS